MAAPVLAYVVDEDFVNGAKDKLNDAIAALPVAYTLDSEGNYTITRFDGSEDVVAFHQVFAKLGTIFEELLPSAATTDEPGLVRKADDELPSDLDSEDKVLSAAATVRLIERLAETAGKGLLEVLNNSHIGEGPIILKPSAARGAAGFHLWAFNNVNQAYEIGRFEIQDNRLIALKYKSDNVLTYDDTTLNCSLGYAIFKGVLKSDSVHIGSQKEVQNATFVTVPIFNNSTQAFEQCRLSIADLRRILNVLINDGTADLWVNTSTIKTPKSIQDPKLIWGGIQTSKGIEQVLCDMPSLAGVLAPYLKPYFGGTGGGGGSDDGLISQFAGCKPEDLQADNEAEYLLDPSTRNVWHSHNFQTADYALTKAYYYDGSGWYQDLNIDTYLEKTSTQFRIKSSAPPDYDTRKVKVYFERINKI